MTKLTNPVALLSRANGTARLTAIDVEAKTCTIYNGKEKTIKWSSAAEYKLDNGAEKTRTLTPKLLTALHDAEAANHPEESPAVSEDVQATSSVPAVVTQEVAPDAEVKEAAPAATDAHESTEPPTAKRQRTPKGTISEREKIFLSLIPTHPDFKSVDSELVSRVLIKKMQELHGVPIDNGRTVFQSLKAKGYYIALGRESGHNLTLFRLTEQGVQYLTDNNLLPAGEAEEMGA